MKSTTSTLLIAAGALLVGGVATAAFMNSRGSAPQAPATTEQLAVEPAAAPALTTDDAAPDNQIEAVGGLQYADVLKVAPITAKEQTYATVIGSEAVRETSSTTTPREVCEDVVVQEQAPRKDPNNIGGTAAGAVIGGLLGHQVGGGSGKKVATAAGAVGGAIAGRKIQQNQADKRVVTRTERQCHTENSTSQTSRVTGYNVTYRNPDGTTGTMRTDSKPGNRIALGKVDQVQGYNVTYRFNGEEKTIRMDDKPASDRLPVVDGQVVAAIPGSDKQG
ncbi:MAG: glycine zipper 2TM domain-containing protein [Pseudoxanthomonas sp.]